MSTKTKNYGLIKPELKDAADITAMNENWDKIDEALDGVSPDYVIEQNKQAEQKFWVGTKAEYDAIPNKNPNTSYTVTDEEDNDGVLLESETHPGCYYRMVGGEMEWENPPMIPFKCYATTERYNGKRVMVTLGEFPLVREEVDEGIYLAWIKVSDYSIVGFEGSAVDDQNNAFFPLNVNFANGQYLNFSIGGKKVNIEYTTIFEGCTLRLIVKYVAG